MLPRIPTQAPDWVGLGNGRECRYATDWSQVDDYGLSEVYEGVQRRVGKRHISQFLEELAGPHVIPGDRNAAYAEMAADVEGERDALEWIEGVVGDVAPVVPALN